MNKKNTNNKKTINKILPDSTGAGYPTALKSTTRKSPWMIYVTDEISRLVNELMVERRWNRTQALNYIFEVFFNEYKKGEK